jgi:hypothetical protein
MLARGFCWNEEPDGDQKRKRLGQIKHSLERFHQPQSLLQALITGPVSATDNGDVRPILGCARHSQRAGEAFTINRPAATKVGRELADAEVLVQMCTAKRDVLRLLPQFSEIADLLSELGEC